MKRFPIAIAAALIVSVVALGSTADAHSGAVPAKCHTKKINTSACTPKTAKILKAQKNNPTQVPIGKPIGKPTP